MLMEKLYKKSHNNVEKSKPSIIGSILRLQIWLLVFLLAVFTVACYEDISGCLDINATNYSVEADLACPDCCEYPVLQIDFQHKAVLPDTILNLTYEDQIYQDGVGNDFRIKNIQYYLSDFHLIRTNRDTVQFSDTLQIQLPGGELVVLKDNFLLVNPGVFGFETLGGFNTENAYSGVGFNFGVNPVANQLDTSYFEEIHPLGAENSEMYLSSEEGYIFAKIELLPELDNDSLVTIVTISGDNNLLPVDILTPFSVGAGVNPRFILFVDYLQWFGGVNVVADDPKLMAEKIVNNIANSFSLVEIQLR